MFHSGAFDAASCLSGRVDALPVRVCMLCGLTWMTLISPIHSPCQSPSRTFRIRDGYKAGWDCRYVLSILGDLVRYPVNSQPPPLPPARCLLSGINLPPTVITCRVLKATTHYIPLPRRLPGRRRSLILHPRFAPIPPPVTAMLNHCVSSNRLPRRHRKRILQTTKNTNSSRIAPVDSVSPRSFAQG